jgi:hypothetical protein
MQHPLLHINTPCCIMTRATVAAMAKTPRKRTPAIEAALDLFRAWGREGGKKGAKARWQGVSPEQRRAHAKKAAAARWSPKRRAT